jgi:hypothetical protein
LRGEAVGAMIPSLEFRDGRARLVAVWKNRETLDRYLSHAPCRAGRS